ncbi:MAG: universal stress protein [Anaerolineae bacterium]|nr:universal stress protein [Anaerolineae bacterium]
MSEPKVPLLTIRRIVVAVDASPHSHAALEAAVDMASRFQAELLALFVEDANVLRAAELPFTHEVGQYSALRRAMERTRMERKLRARSRRIEESFRLLADRGTVQGTFRVARGNVGSEIHSAAQEADVLIVGRAGWSQIRRRQLGSTARAACSDSAPGVTMVLREGERISPPIHAVYDGSVLSEHALGIAAALVERLAQPLRVLLLAHQVDQVEGMKERAAAQLHPYDVIRQYQVLTSVPDLMRAVRTTGPGTLVLPARLLTSDGEAILTLIEETDLPVLLVR